MLEYPSRSFRIHGSQLRLYSTFRVRLGSWLNVDKWFKKLNGRELHSYIINIKSNLVTLDLLTYLLTHLPTYSLTYLLTYLLTPYSTVLLEKLTGSAASQKNSPNFMETEGSLPHSQVPATCPCSEPDPGHTLTSHFLKIHLNIILPSTPGSCMWSLSLRFPH
jgi:hypothetical protein